MKKRDKGKDELQKCLGRQKDNIVTEKKKEKKPEIKFFTDYSIHRTGLIINLMNCPFQWL